MRHALIVGHDRIREELLEARLWEAGFASMAHAWTLEDAWDAVQNRETGLVVVLREEGQCFAAEDLLRISERANAPVLMVTSNLPEATRCLGKRAWLEGPYDLDEMESAPAALMPALMEAI